MSIDSLAGTWTITVNSPIGAREATLHLETSAEGVTGSMQGMLGTTPLKNGAIVGDTARWDIDFVGMMGPMMLGFAGTAEGDSISGTVQFGAFGSGTFSGTRVPEAAS